jgi:hypothetical protein
MDDGQEATGRRWRRRLGRRGARRRPGIGRGGRGDLVDVLTRGGRQGNRPDFEGQRSPVVKLAARARAPAGGAARRAAAQGGGGGVQEGQLGLAQEATASFYGGTRASGALPRAAARCGLRWAPERARGGRSGLGRPQAQPNLVG